MNIKRFFGKNSKLALAQVREALGENAVILSNRVVNGGNEIMAFSEADMDSVPAYGDNNIEPLNNDVIEDAQNSSLEALFRKRMQAEPASYKKNNLVMDETFEDTAEFEYETTASYKANTQVETRAPARTAANVKSAPTAAPKIPQDRSTSAARSNSQEALISQQVLAQQTLNHTLAQQSLAKEVNTQIATMMNEIRNMRSVIESQLAEISWGAIQHRDPIRANTLGMLLSAGFSAELSKQLAEKMPSTQSLAEASKWVQSVLLTNFNAISKDDEILDQGGIFALVGPTGVGKTTTTAKLAARYVMKHGTEKIGLITTDSYRIGGHEQLRIYGKILGVMVHSVKDEADLKIALNELKNKHTILIDTVGVSQRDQMVSQQIAMLSNSQSKIKKLLCLNATNTGETLLDVVKAYKGKGLDGCIMTKMDEAITLGNVIDVMIREKLKLFYVANGQRVPEDLHVAHKQQLIHRAFKLGAARSSPFQYENKDLPFVMANAVNTREVNSKGKSFSLELNHA